MAEVCMEQLLHEARALRLLVELTEVRPEATEKAVHVEWGVGKSRTGLQATLCRLRSKNLAARAKGRGGIAWRPTTEGRRIAEELDRLERAARESAVRSLWPAAPESVPLVKLGPGGEYTREWPAA